MKKLNGNTMLKTMSLRRGEIMSTNGFGAITKTSIAYAF
jgi:hypothetical protein